LKFVKIYLPQLEVFEVFWNSSKFIYFNLKFLKFFEIRQIFSPQLEVFRGILRCASKINTKNWVKARNYKNTWFYLKLVKLLSKNMMNIKFSNKWIREKWRTVKRVWIWIFWGFFENCKKKYFFLPQLEVFRGFLRCASKINRKIQWT